MWYYNIVKRDKANHRAAETPDKSKRTSKCDIWESQSKTEITGMELNVIEEYQEYMAS